MYALRRDCMSKKNTRSLISDLFKKSFPSKVLTKQTALKACASVMMAAIPKYAIPYSEKAATAGLRA